MKIFKYFLLAAVAAFSLTACNAREQADFSALSEILTDRDYQYISVSPTTFTGNGLIHSDLSCTYYYLDYETMTEIPLCPDPNCEHGANYEKNQRANDDCGAHYHESAFYYNGAMYFTEYKWKKRGTAEQDQLLRAADIDGQNRRTVAVFEDYDYIVAMARVENILYLLLNKPIWGDSDKSDNLVPMDVYLSAVDLLTEKVIFEEKICGGSDESYSNGGFVGYDHEGYVYFGMLSYTISDDLGATITDESGWRVKVDNVSPIIENAVDYDKVGGDWRVVFDRQEKIFSARYKNLTFEIALNVSRVSSFMYGSKLYFWHYQKPDLYYLDGETGTIYIAENCLEQMVAGIQQCLCDIYDDCFIFSEAEGGSIFTKRSRSEFDFHEYEGEYERTGS